MRKIKFKMKIEGGMELDFIKEDTFLVFQHEMFIPKWSDVEHSFIHRQLKDVPRIVPDSPDHQSDLYAVTFYD